MKGKGKIKTGAMGMIACLTLSTLTGCSMQPVVDEDGEATITIWHDKEDAVTQVLEDALSELEPEIHVVLEKKSDLTETLKMVGNDPKAAPDMYLFAHDKIGVYAEMGILAPVTDILLAQ